MVAVNCLQWLSDGMRLNLGKASVQHTLPHGTDEAHRKITAVNIGCLQHGRLSSAAGSTRFAPLSSAQHQTGLQLLYVQITTS